MYVSAYEVPLPGHSQDNAPSSPTTSVDDNGNQNRASISSPTEETTPPEPAQQLVITGADLDEWFGMEAAPKAPKPSEVPKVATAKSSGKAKSESKTRKKISAGDDDEEEDGGPNPLVSAAPADTSGDESESGKGGLRGYSGGGLKLGHYEAPKKDRTMLQVDSGRSDGKEKPKKLRPQGVEPLLLQEAPVVRQQPLRHPPSRPKKVKRRQRRSNRKRNLTNLKKRQKRLEVRKRRRNPVLRRRK